MAVSKRLRFEVLRRDNHACRYCGAAAPDVKLTVDHVMPTALGGSDDPTNLVTACSGCNSGKSATAPDSPIVADVEADALRWAAAMARAAEFQQQADREFNGIALDVRMQWDEWRTTDDGGFIPRPGDWQSSLRQLNNAGLSEDDLLDMIGIAMNARGVAVENTWRYYCGVGWRRLENRQQIARQILEAEN